MLRKLLVRLLATGLMIFAAVVTALAFAVYLALQSPDFYVELRDRPLPASQKSDIQHELQSMETAFRLWLERSIARQKTEPLAANASGEPSSLHVYDPAGDVHTVRLTEDMLNAALASDDLHWNREFQRPRIRLFKGGIAFAFEFSSPQIHCVPSVELQPVLAPSGDLRIEIVNAHIGNLPLPFRTILGLLPREASTISRGLQFNPSPPAPHFAFDVANWQIRHARLHSIECQEGEIVLMFLPPIVAPAPQELVAL